MNSLTCWQFLFRLLTNYYQSILSHIPRNTDFSKIKLFILIHSPGLKDSTIETPASNLPPASLSSSFSNISHNQAQTPGDETKSPLYVISPNLIRSLCTKLTSVQTEIKWRRCL